MASNILGELREMSADLRVVRESPGEGGDAHRGEQTPPE